MSSNGTESACWEPASEMSGRPAARRDQHRFDWTATTRWRAGRFSWYFCRRWPAWRTQCFEKRNAKIPTSNSRELPKTFPADRMRVLQRWKLGLGDVCVCGTRRPAREPEAKQVREVRITGGENRSMSAITFIAMPTDVAPALMRAVSAGATGRSPRHIFRWHRRALPPLSTGRGRLASPI